MRITARKNMVGLSEAGANARETLARHCRAASWGISKAVAGIRDPRLRADLHRLLDAYLTGRPPESPPLLEERSRALASICETLLRQFDDEQAGAAEIRLVVHKRGELPVEPAIGSPPDSRSSFEAEREELLWELRRLIASSGTTIADVARALETRGEALDPMGRELLREEIVAVEVDIATLKTVLSEPVDWDVECQRLIAGEVPPFEDLAVGDDEDDEDD